MVDMRRTMDIFGTQAQAKLRTAQLQAYFHATVLLFIGLFYLVAAFFFIRPYDLQRLMDGNPGKFRALVDQYLPTGFVLVSENPWSRPWWNPALFAAVALGVGGTIYTCSAVKLAALRRAGGRGVAEGLGCEALNPRSPNPADRALWNVVQEMAVASGIRPPSVYVMEREPAANAFAAGDGEADAVVGVTRGALELFTREEMQGVVAHEFSHILNGDMRLNTHLIGVLYGLMVVSDWGERMVQAGIGEGDEEGQMRSLGPAVMVLGWVVQGVGGLGLFAAQIIKAAISRQREILADAAAAQFTRHPEALASGLKKLLALQTGTWMHAAGRGAVSHMFFANGLRGFDAGLFSTHPPLELRILALDPAWDGSLPEVDRPSVRVLRPGESLERAVTAEQGRLVENRMASELARLMSPKGTGRTAPMAAGAERVPGEMWEIARTTDGAPGLVYAMFADAAGGRAALRAIEGRCKEAERDAARDLLEAVKALPGPGALALLDTALDSVRCSGAEGFRVFEACAGELLAANTGFGWFHQAAWQRIQRRLAPYFRNPFPAAITHRTIEEVLPEAAILVSALAWTRGGGEAAQAAFAEGFAALKAFGQAGVLASGRDCGFEAAAGALERIAAAADYLRQDVVEACRVAGGWPSPSDEARVMLEAIAGTLDVPLGAEGTGVAV